MKLNQLAIPKQFSIAELEQYSGIRTHTLRIWEKRFEGFFKPGRTASNLRRYSVNELFAVLELGLLVKNGFRISFLLSLSSADRSKLLHTLSGEDCAWDRTIMQLLHLHFCGDIVTFEKVLEHSIHDWGIEIVIEQVIRPFMEKIQLYSYADTTADMHFTVTALRKKLIRGIEALPSAPGTYPTVLLFLPEGAHYDLHLLLLNYTLKKAGYSILYLGTNINAQTLAWVVKEKDPGLVVTYVPSCKKALNMLLQDYRHHAVHARLIITVPGELPQGIQGSGRAGCVHYDQLLDAISS